MPELPVSHHGGRVGANVLRCVFKVSSRKRLEPERETADNRLKTGEPSMKQRANAELKLIQGVGSAHVSLKRGADILILIKRRTLIIVEGS